jgi:hypothetical protein
MSWKSILLGVLATSGIIVLAVTHSPIYSGKEVFKTEEAYQEFKQALVDTNATYEPEMMSVLSSEPPIIVNFRNVDTHGNEFDYGRKESELLNLLFAAVGIVIIWLFLIYVENYESVY